MSNSHDVQNFKIGSCALSFKGDVLGGTQNPPQIKVDPQIYESKCDQSGGLVLREIITGMKVSISADLKEIDYAFEKMLNDGNRNDEIVLSDSVIGVDLKSKGGVLRLTPVNPDDNYGYEFPNAVMRPSFSYKLDGNQEHVLGVEFVAHPDDSGVIMRRFSIG